MFKSLKDKLGETLSGSLLPVGQNRPVGRGKASNSSTPSGSLLDLSSPMSTLDPFSASTPNDLPFHPTSRSRTSSVSSQASDLSFLSPVSTIPTGILDLEGSFSEVETDSSTVTSMNKDTLYQMYCKAQKNSRQYKAWYLQVFNGYKELEKERDKLKNTLTQTQDKALRRMSDLKQQLAAKKDVENDYSLLLSNKDELVKLLQMQISLIQEGKPIPEELLLKSKELSTVPDTLGLSSDLSAGIDANSNISPDVDQQKERIKRLESLLTKCQEMLKVNRERMQQLSSDREAMAQQLDMKVEELDQVKEEHKETTLKFQSQLKDARKLIEELEADKVMSQAALKQELHQQLEAKDSELVETRQKVKVLEMKNTNLEEDVQKISKKGMEDLEKSNEIIKRLTVEKQKLEEEMTQKLEKSEHNLEMEKDSELQELRRGKVEALQVLQRQMQEKVLEMEKLRDAALEERDRQWEERIAQKDKSNRNEFDKLMAEKLEEMSLAIEEQQLQKTAAVKQCDLAASDLRNQCDMLTQEKKELEIRLQNVHSELSSKTKSLEDDIQERSSASNAKLQEMSTMHSHELTLLREESAKELSAKLEEMRVEYTLKLGELRTNYDQKLQDSLAEADTTQGKTIADQKKQNEAVIEELKRTIDRQQSEIEESAKQHMELEARVAELQKEVCTRMQIAEQRQKDIEELELKSKKDRETFQERLKDLIMRIDYQSNSLDALVVENTQLHAELSKGSNGRDKKRPADVVDGHSEGNESNLEENKPESDSLKDEATGGGVHQPVAEINLEDQKPFANRIEEMGVEELQAEVRRLEAEAISRRDMHAKQIASSIDTIRSLEQRISDLMERENHLNVELEQSRKENERNLLAHHGEVIALREMIEKFQSSEKVLEEQLRATDERCDSELARLNVENMSAMKGFSELVEVSHKEMAQILGEMMEMKERSNEVVESLEQKLHLKCLELEKAHEQIKELGGSIEQVDYSTELDPAGIHEPPTDSAPFEMLPQLTTVAEIPSDGITSQQMQTHPRDGGEDQMANGTVSPHLIQHTLQRDSHELLSVEVPIASSEELIQRIIELEQSLADRENKLKWFESKVEGFGEQIKQETEEMRMRSRQVELLMADKDALLKEKEEETNRQAEILKTLQTELIRRIADFKELEEKFWKLQGEAKSRILSLKKRLEEKDAGKEVDLPEKVRQLQEDFSADMAEMKLQHEMEVKALKEQIEVEKNNLTKFQENVKKQFEERQGQVKSVITNIRDSCDQSLKDRDNYYEIKLMNLERMKAAEIRGLNATIEKLKEERGMDTEDNTNPPMEEINYLKAELESYKVRHREALSRFQSEREALLKHSGKSNEQVMEILRELERQNEERERHSIGKEVVSTSKSLLESELEKLSVENNVLKQRIRDLEKQRAAVLEVARESRVLQEMSEDCGVQTEPLEEMETKNVEEELERSQKALESLEKAQKELIEKQKDDEEKTAKFLEEMEECKKMNQLQQDLISELNTTVCQLEEMNRTCQKSLHRQEHSVVPESLEVNSTSVVEEVQKMPKTGSAEEKLSAKVVELQNELLSQDTKFAIERDRLIEENVAKCKMYEQKVAEMKKVDAELKELLDKIGIIANHASKLEQVVENYRKAEEEHKRIREAAESAELGLERLRQLVEDKNQIVTEKTEALAAMEIKLRENDSTVFRLNKELETAVENANTELEAKLDAAKCQYELTLRTEISRLKEEQINKSCDKCNASMSPSQKNEGFCDESQIMPSDVIEVTSFSASCDGPMISPGVDRVERRLHKVIVPSVETITASGETRSLDGLVAKEWHEKEIERTRAEYKAGLQQLEEEHNAKVIQLAKDFNIQMVEREKQIRESLEEEIDSLHRTESRLLSDHRDQTRELNQRMDEVVQNCEAQIQAAEARHKDHMDSLNKIIENLQQTLLDKEHDWMISREAAHTKDEERRIVSAVHGNQLFHEELIKNSVPLTNQGPGNQILKLEAELNELRRSSSIEVNELKRRLERYESSPMSPLVPGLDHRSSLIALSADDDVCRILELQNTNLQAEVSRQLAENSRLKEREQELLHQLDSRTSSFFGSHGNYPAAGASSLGSLLMEPTELEYLKNILFSYMIGLETKTLAKVICKVVRFSEDQTRVILEKEDSRKLIFGPAHR